MSVVRLLAFPWHIGAGHTGRCLAFAGMAAAAGFPVLATAVARPKRFPVPSVGYLAITGPGDAYASVGYYHASRIRDHVERDRELIRRFRPTFVVTHMQPTCVIAARCEGVPVLSVADADFLVTGDHGWMPWLGPDGARVSPFPSSLGAFNEALTTYGQPPVGQVSDLLLGDATLIASVPELEQPDAAYVGHEAVHYIGPLLWDPDVRGELAARLASFSDSGRTKVYASVGGGSGTYATAGGGGNAPNQLAAAALAAVDLASWSVLLAGGLGARNGDDGGRPHLMLQGFGGIRAAVSWADVVVCHGGHSTVVASLLAGKPVVVVPSMSEMEGNGRFLVQDNGLGVVMVTSELNGRDRLRLVRRYPVADPDCLVDGPALIRAVEDLLADRSYRTRAEEMSTLLSEAANGARAKALALLERARH
jgi:hypothetical protein